MAWNYPRVFSRMGNYTLASPAVAIQIKSSSMRIKTNSSPLQITSLTIVSTPKMLSIPEYSSKHLILNVYSNYIYLSKPYHYSTTISPPQGLAASAASKYYYLVVARFLVGLVFCTKVTVLWPDLLDF